MKKIIGLFLLIWTIGSAQVSAQSETNRLDSIMPVRAWPSPLHPRRSWIYS